MEILQSSVGIRPSPKGEKPLHCFPMLEQLLCVCIEEMVNTVTAVVQENCHIIVRQLAQALDISKSSVRMIQCEKLKMWRVADCWVPHFLTREQRDNHTEICCERLKRIGDEPDVMGHVTVDDESWIHHFNPATKEERMHY